eukprot:scpid106556/ scgid19277/ 
MPSAYPAHGTSTSTSEHMSSNSTAHCQDEPGQYLLFSAGSRKGYTRFPLTTHSTPLEVSLQSPHSQNSSSLIEASPSEEDYRLCSFPGTIANVCSTMTDRTNLSVLTGAAQPQLNIPVVYAQSSGFEGTPNLILGQQSTVVSSPPLVPVAVYLQPTTAAASVASGPVA